MKLSTFKKILPSLETISFQLEDGTEIPKHFHITEVGMISKKYIDCGGTVRKEKVVSFQLWNADDFDHRLKPKKLLNIIKLSEKKLGIKNLTIEVEYQSDTIGKYGLIFAEDRFVLTSKQTNCLAEDSCGIPSQKPIEASSSCSPESGCC